MAPDVQRSYIADDMVSFKCLKMFLKKRKLARRKLQSSQFANLVGAYATVINQAILNDVQLDTCS